MFGTTIFQKKCIICGKEFEAKGPHANVCGDACRRQRDIEYTKSYRKKRKKAAVAHKSLEQVAVEARAAGMTYGEYVAKMESNIN